MCNLIKTSCTAAVLLLLASETSADLQAGLDAYDIGEYATSLAECQPLADAGIPAAQFCVGRLYANGFGVAMDDTLALRWYGLAAGQGYLEAQYNLGVMHANGWGVEMSAEKAAALYGPAAEKGFVPALIAFADMCHRGMGVEQSSVEAYIWYGIAAELGSFNAEFKLEEIAYDLSPDEVAAAKQSVQDRLANIDVESMRVDHFE